MKGLWRYCFQSIMERKIQDTLNKFRNKKIRIISKNNFTYITLDFEYFGEDGISFIDKIGHDVMLSVSDIKKIEVLL